MNKLPKTIIYMRLYAIIKILGALKHCEINFREPRIDEHWS